MMHDAEALIRHYIVPGSASGVLGLINQTKGVIVQLTSIKRVTDE